MKESIKITFDTKPVKRLFDEFPKIANQEANKGYTRVAKTFMNEFARKRLIKGVYLPKRKVKLHRHKNQIKLNAKSHKAGFIATLFRKNKLDKKGFTVRTSNPLLVGREKGDTIKPKKKKYLYIMVDPSKAFKGKKYSFKGRGKKEKREKFLKKSQHYKWRGSQKVIVAKMESVGPFPKLRFISSWNSFYSTKAIGILNKVPLEVIRRADLKQHKFARKAA